MRLNIYLEKFEVQLEKCFGYLKVIIILNCIILYSLIFQPQVSFFRFLSSNIKMVLKWQSVGIIPRKAQSNRESPPFPFQNVNHTICNILLYVLDNINNFLPWDEDLVSCNTGTCTYTYDRRHLLVDTSVWIIFLSVFAAFILYRVVFSKKK